MCIILTCESNIRPDFELTDNCFAANPDGAGIMWVEDGKVMTAKGFTDPAVLMAAVESVPIDSNIVIHFRIATSGGIDVGTCHPFPITDDLDVLHARAVECDAAVAHNGIIVGMPTNKALGISDTISFVSNVITPMFRGRVSRRLRKKIVRMAPDNRFAIMTKDGRVFRIGEGWETVRRGIQASNSSWRWPVYGFDDLFNIEKKEDDPFDKAMVEANDIAMNYSGICEGCQHFAACAEYGATCDEVVELADWFADEIVFEREHGWDYATA